ncbi:ferredoxin--NADP reductase [Halobacterium sp. KA-6]|uniref:ferredoxin--NADP reductase n=1 Tax=Halobacterium sp. KA-6 TaxID=2896368 RepID=UPI001E478868|nr:FAD-binding oxidoreductase [Halobacterium sp. KA-6]MCD2205069.1 FAD-binding oxidoreductase [Halobacterium sp. KA-6]
MTIREHNSQHEHAQSLPLISESATVTSVDAMDRDRRSEIRRKLLALGKRHGFEDTIPDTGKIDWTAVFEAATTANRRLAPQIGAFRDRYERAHPALVSITLDVDNPVKFAAGQYVSLRYNGRTRPYSVASSPNRDDLELCIRRVPDGRLSPKLCDDLSVGDEVTVRGPNGHLLLENQSKRDLAFLATGTGVAPMKSMIDYLFEDGRDEYQGEPRDIWLFLGAAWEDDLPYHDAFQERAATHDNFHYVPCLSRESWLADWAGETEYIQDALLKYVEERALDDAVFGRHIAEMLRTQPDVEIEARIDPHELEVYACGINAMVYSLETAVTRLGVPTNHVHCEGYG